MRVKICGLSEEASLRAAVEAGASYVGFVFYGKSPRNLSVSKARALTLEVPEGICKVALTVDATDAFLENLLADIPIDMLQLHGQETPERVAALRDRYGLPVMKAVGVSDENDLGALSEYARVCDQLLCDAKPTKPGDLPGGNGLSFDWRLIAGRKWGIPWMLAGGLTPENVADAVRLTGATQVDVSSGVETAPGVKGIGKIRAFIRAANLAKEE